MCNDYRSWNMFMGMPSTGYKGQMTLRGEKNETGEEYAKRVLSEIHTWYGLGWQVERAYFDDGKIVQRVNVETEADLNAALAGATAQRRTAPMSNNQCNKLIDLYVERFGGSVEDAARGLDVAFESAFKHPISEASLAEAAKFISMIIAQKPSNSPAPTTPTPEGSGMFVMHVQKFKISSDKGGLPVLEFYQTGHQWPDLRYSFGKTMEERKANCAKLLSNIAGPVSPDAIVINTDKPVSWDVVWKTGRDPKYKDVVSVGPHINGKAA